MLKPFLFVFKNLKEKKASHTVCSELIYGVPGSGKTYYASPSHTVGSGHRRGDSSTGTV